MTEALIVIDVQRGFSDPFFGRRNNPACETNVKRLLDAWQGRGLPIVLVRHDSTTPGFPLTPGQPGNEFKSELDGVRADLVYGKRVHSAFHGEVDLDAWLRRRGIERLLVVGIQTNLCVETTSRVGGNLGYTVRVAVDATHTFDMGGLTAEELTAATVANLTGGRFATVVTTDDVLAEA